MNYFQYPLDTKMLFRKKEIIKKELLDASKEWVHTKIAVLGGSTTDEVVKQLEIFLLNYGIKIEYYQSEYGQYWQDSMFGNERLDTFQPDLIYIHTSWRNIKRFPTITDTKTDATKKLEAEYQQFEEMWSSIERKYHCPIIQNNFDRPNYRLMGNRDIWDYRGRSYYISELNQRFYLYAQQHENFYINDLEYIAQDYGLSEWGNSRYWYMYKYAMCLNAIPYVADSVAKIVKSILGKNKKVLSLDLDNTLWGGVIGDDGLEGIQIGKDTPKGQLYSEFQEYCRNLQQMGILLTINSKNNYENALAGFDHPDGILKKDHFVNIKANWNTKDRNLEETAEELALGTDAFVFVDDNPAEREIVTTQLPEVAVPKMDRVENYINIIDHSGFFEVTTLSEEDVSKTKKYHARAEAVRMMAKFNKYEEYLDNLQMAAVFDDFKSIYTQRIAQLTNKSNQFNLTTLRCTEDDIRKMQENENYICLCGKLSDKFEDQGIVIVVAGEIVGVELQIRLFLMSCRVLKRGMENLAMNKLVDMARDQGVRKIIGYYQPTIKNKIVRDFYQTMGFELKEENESGRTVWEIETEKYSMKEVHIIEINTEK